MAETIKNNSYVLFYFNRSKKWLRRITRGEELHTHIGVLRYTDAIGCTYGSRLVTNKSKYVYLFRPTLYDHVMKLQHGTQIVYPKEIGYIVARAGIGSGQKILEIGTGSGSLTSFIANVVRPRGHVYSFDVDDSFMKIAQKNIDRAGVSKYVTLHNLDIKTIDCSSAAGAVAGKTLGARTKHDDTLPVSDADVALIDLGDPWTVLPQVRQMLRDSGCLFAVCPTVNQLERLTEALVENQFTDIESTEQILRNIEARPGKTRHSFQGIGHTTYMCFARKAFFARGENGGGGSSGDKSNDAKNDTTVAPTSDSDTLSKPRTARRRSTKTAAAAATPAKDTPAKDTVTRGKKPAAAKTATVRKKKDTRADKKDSAVRKKRSVSKTEKTTK